MQDNIICYGILVCLSSLLVLIAKNGYALNIIAVSISKMIATNLGEQESFRCKYDKDTKDAREKEKH